MNLVIPININLEEEFVEDILATALEGGSNYWIKCHKKEHKKHLQI